MPTTKPIPSRDPKRPFDDLRVIKGGDGRIISDRRPQQRGQPVKRVKVIGPKKQ